MAHMGAQVLGAGERQGIHNTYNVYKVNDVKNVTKHVKIQNK